MKRATLGAFAFWPLAMFTLMLVAFVSDALFESWFFPLWIACSVIFFFGWALFIWNVWHNDRLPAEKRALWTVVLVIAGPYALPFYFWFYIR